MAKGAAVIKQEDIGGYYLYSDGYSSWGIGTLRNFEFPIKINKELHNKSTEDKLKYYQETMAAKNAKEKEAADKEREEAKANRKSK